MKTVFITAVLSALAAYAGPVTQEVVTVKSGTLFGGSNAVHAVAAQAAREEGSNYFKKGGSEVNATFVNGTTTAQMRVTAAYDNVPSLGYTRVVNGALNVDYDYIFPKASGTVAFKTKSTTLGRDAEPDQIGDLYEKYDQTAESLTAVALHLNAEDARFVSTNYYSNVPEAFVEIKVSNTWIAVWKEMNRWNKFAGSEFDWNSWGGFQSWKAGVASQLDEKATKNWGLYDSETGEVSPDGFTQISSSNILVAANMSYKRVVNAANSVWVLQCNNGTFSFGGETNGYFRVKDGDGNTQFEIINGNQRELGCDASGITVSQSGGNTIMTIPYSVEAVQHPTLKMSASLSDPDWKTEQAGGTFPGMSGVTVGWTGSTGSYVAAVTLPGSYSQMFVKASYLGGSETVINNIAPTKMQYIYIGNTKYAVGYATISGTGVMTLTPQ